MTLDFGADCVTCGMFVHENFAATHKCPEPLLYDSAVYLAQALPFIGPVHPRLYARIKLGLEAGEPRPKTTKGQP